MALRDRLRRAPEARFERAPSDEPAADLGWPSPPAAEAEPATAADWSAEPGFAVAVEERTAAAPGDWTAATEPVDVTDHTVELPALAAAPGPGRRRALRAALTLALVLCCAGAALAASGVLRKKDEMPAPVRIGAASSIATKPVHRAKAKAKPAKRAPHHVRHRHRARRHVAVAPAHVVASAPATSAPPRPAPVVHRVVSRPAPAPVAAPKPAPTPVASKPTTTAAQPAPSAPSGEPGRQPPPTP